MQQVNPALYALHWNEHRHHSKCDKAVCQHTAAALSCAAQLFISTERITYLLEMSKNMLCVAKELQTL